MCSDTSIRCTACNNVFDKTDIIFRCSTIGAATLPYCKSCGHVNAEDEEIVNFFCGDPSHCANWVVVYDKESDWYRYYYDNVKLDPIENINTRTELNKKFKEINN